MATMTDKKFLADAERSKLEIRNSDRNLKASFTVARNFDGIPRLGRRCLRLKPKAGIATAHHLSCERHVGATAYDAFRM
jgi:hypothetical protein